jgi:hypothetical protein
MTMRANPTLARFSELADEADEAAEELQAAVGDLGARAAG